jgi:hypothetical protein
MQIRRACARLVLTSLLSLDQGFENKPTRCGDCKVMIVYMLLRGACCDAIPMLS